jgi:hypothetical protein
MKTKSLIQVEIARTRYGSWSAGVNVQAVEIL